MKSKLFGSVLLLAGLLFFALGCPQQGIEPGIGTLQINLTDAPGEFEKVNIAFSEVSIHRGEEQSTLEVQKQNYQNKKKDVDIEDNIHNQNGENWIIISDGIREFNLLDYQNGAFDILATADLSAGVYTQIRLKIVERDEQGNLLTYIKLEDDETLYPLKVPSGAQSGLKLIHPFTIYEGSITTLLLDFDAEKSVKQTGNGQFKLKPTIKVISQLANQGIRGTVEASTPEETAVVGAKVFAYNDQNNLVDETTTNPDGYFEIALPVGTYTLEINAVGYSPATSDPITVEEELWEEVVIKLDPESWGIGPGELPDWHAESQVQLGWVFEDPRNPENSSPLPGWDKAIGDTPVWSYDAERIAFNHPGQWYINIPNLVNDNPAKKFWISWVYEFETYQQGDRTATNIDWSPDTGHDNIQYVEEWFDADGNLTTNYLEAAYGRVTHSLDLYPNPAYEDIWLGLYSDSKNVVEVYIKTLCVAGIDTESIGPGELPDWHAESQVQLGWVFEDPRNPENSSPLPGWDKAIGDTPVWSYDAERITFNHPGQWYINIPNLVNDNPAKKFWISWVYEFETYQQGDRTATNIDWSPDTGHDNIQYVEEWFDADGNLTTNYLEAAYGRVTHSLDLYPNPAYEDIWLGLYSDSKNVVEVYIKTLCVAGIDTESIGPGELPDWHAESQVQLGWVFEDPRNPENSSPLPGWDKAIGDTPVWSYDAERIAFNHPGQWYINIPNLVNDNPAKKFWISWVYEFETYQQGDRTATNIDWSPDTGHDNIQYVEEWFDADGNLTTNYLEAAYGRVTHSLDLYPNPAYEDIWLGLYSDSKNVVEVYIKTLCVAGIDTES